MVLAIITHNPKDNFIFSFFDITLASLRSFIYVILEITSRIGQHLNFNSLATYWLG